MFLQCCALIIDHSESYKYLKSDQSFDINVSYQISLCPLTTSQLSNQEFCYKPNQSLDQKKQFIKHNRKIQSPLISEICEKYFGKNRIFATILYLLNKRKLRRKYRGKIFFHHPINRKFAVFSFSYRWETNKCNEAAVSR